MINFASKEISKKLTIDAYNRRNRSSAMTRPSSKKGTKNYKKPSVDFLTSMRQL